MISPTNENLESALATEPLTAWLVHAAKSRTTVTYGQARSRLELECGFGTIFTVRTGIVAGAAMNRLLAQVPQIPLLNVLLVQATTGLPGSGAVGYLAKRYPNRRWLRGEVACRDRRWRNLIEEEASRVYAYRRWEIVYKQVYGSLLPVPVREEVRGSNRRHSGRGGEGPNHRALRLKVTGNPSLVRRGLRPEGTDTEVDLRSGDRVDVVSIIGDRTVAMEIKSKDSDWTDLRRGVYQCVKYRAVLAAQDIRRDPAVECWLVTESPLPGDLKDLARQLGVRTKAL